jgi:hypothetical protein
MGRFRTVLAALILLIPLTVATASAVTIRDILELTKAGLSDEILLALIDVDRPVFTIDTPTLKMLKDAGVSEAVIVAMIRSGRTPPATHVEIQQQQAPAVTSADPNSYPNPDPYPNPAAYPNAAPEPQVIVIDHHDAVQVPVAYPVGIPVFVSSVHQRRVPDNSTIGIPTMGVGGNLLVNPAVRATGSNNLSPRNNDLSPRFNNLSPRGNDPGPQFTAPVYWGFGGKLRPGSWQPTGR